MSRQEAIFYAQDRVNEEEPRRIIAYFVEFKRIMAHEEVLAVFGSMHPKTASLVDNSAIVLKDRIEYAETQRFIPKMAAVSFEFLDQVYLLPEGTLKYVSVVDKSKSSVRFQIRSAVTDTTAFYELIREIKNGARRKEKPQKVVSCKGCGASCTVFQGEESECEYCGTRNSF